MGDGETKDLGKRPPPVSMGEADPFDAMLREAVSALDVTPREPGFIVEERYRLEHQLGRGGMSVVWAATHVVTLRRVALKFMNGPRDQWPELAGRFRREARAASIVEHPAVLPVHDIFEIEAGEMVMVMDLLEGETLRDKLVRDGALTLSETAAVMVPVIGATRAAHAAGVVHRDLKPGNIFLCSEAASGERVRVLDFGLARLASAAGLPGGDLQTVPGSVLGTPAYMAPEQAVGEAIDHRADVWALGAILYECLHGEGPVHAETASEAVDQLLGGKMTPLAEASPDLPAAICDLVGRMLVVDPKCRLSDLGEALAVLESLAGD